MSFVVELNNGDAPKPYWSASQQIHPAGHWGERSEALQFARESDAHAFIAVYLSHQAEVCKVVPF